jgi:hypothetical protein
MYCSFVLFAVASILVVQIGNFIGNPVSIRSWSPLPSPVFQTIQQSKTRVHSIMDLNDYKVR